jgi:imidazolonepropionase-like amidohydrolase
MHGPEGHRLDDVNHPERLQDPLLGLVAPEVERGTASQPETARAILRSLVRDEGPPMPDLLRDMFGRWWFREAAQYDALRRSQAAVRRLHAAGVPIVVGSDTPFRPAIAYGFHGVSTLRELELVGGAGLSPAEALQAATRVPAEMLALAGEIGTVEVGKRADLVVVRADPLSDLRALRTVAWTVKDGVARTPQEWIEE